ncbi:lysophospholipase [Fulvivirga maritima]|uniref:alpha/beta hydrolase n=1 Tax=Fulvivirga maritima TaxID=2904247 RepID=UPI001F385010|nr:lysophospholipase [Fulvivirga maritima]UII28401.1 lysophospholipase [Fulvivirga maritima]
MKFLKWMVAIILLLVAIYFTGPKVEPPELNRELPEVSHYLYQLEADIEAKEEAVGNVKPDNEARIVWYDSAYQKTPYSLVYLHGFSASQKEGFPLHEEIAKRYGMNLYLARLHSHGVDAKEPMLDLTTENYVNSAKEAIAIGEQLGEKTILFATSTGGTLSLYLAGGDENIAGLILFSPNIKVYQPEAFILNKHWGLQIARIVQGSDYIEWEISPERKPYWQNKYRIEAVTQLQELLDVTMTDETFAQVTQPTFLGYYYKNDSLQDHTVSVEAELKMFDKLGTPDALKRKVAFPEAGHHVIGSSLTSEDLPSVRKETYQFIEEILKLKPVPVKEKSDSVTTVEPVLNPA